MTHIRIDDEVNSKRKFACGIGPDLPVGDVYFFEAESWADRRCDCAKCREALGLSKKPRQLGTPISQLSSRPGNPGYEKFCAIAKSWGCDREGSHHETQMRTMWVGSLRRTGLFRHRVPIGRYRWRSMRRYYCCRRFPRRTALPIPARNHRRVQARAEEIGLHLGLSGKPRRASK